MCRRLLHVGFLLAAFASLLGAPQVGYAQFNSYPGDWPQPGRGPGYGSSGFQRLSVALRFPYDGINSVYTSSVIMQPVASLASASAYPSPDMARVYIRVQVPASAQVRFDGNPTAQTGTNRLFMSPSLPTGSTYTYQISAQWLVHGKEQNESRVVRVVPGQIVDVDFAK